MNNIDFSNDERIYNLIQKNKPFDYPLYIIRDYNTEDPNIKKIFKYIYHDGVKFSDLLKKFYFEINKNSNYQYSGFYFYTKKNNISQGITGSTPLLHLKLSNCKEKEILRIYFIQENVFG